MMRILSIMALLIAALSFDTRATRAAEGPWCANINIGTGNVYEDCQYYSFEVCQPVILAGNRGFCNVNPRWVGPRQTAACGKTSGPILICALCHGCIGPSLLAIGSDLAADIARPYIQRMRV